MSRYDQRTTMFSPEGRVYQVEYALQSIEHAPAAIAILTSGGIIFAAEKRIPSPLLDTEPKTELGINSEKMMIIDHHIACVVAGMTSDSHILIQHAREIAQQHRYTYREDISVEDVAVRIADLKQSYTQYGGLRPFGTSLLIAGYDEQCGMQIYLTDPSGNYTQWKAHAIGNGSTTAIHFLKNEWKEGISLDDGLKLVLRAMGKTLDATITEEKVEVGVFQVKDGSNANFEMLPIEKLKTLIGEVVAK
ncbi:20S proteasome subunit alpha [Perkinsela sp. CCAP 1560/4]|nr:20S proteasome subunit alpha [Perkinsela sp. CCAP 1560/4]|eukprot:KNH05064.1 20S proteasome subunit alpha [Perkinsela sp. CCAP 1560/4]